MWAPIHASSSWVEVFPCHSFFTRLHPHAKEHSVPRNLRSPHQFGRTGNIWFFSRTEGQKPQPYTGIQGFSRKNAEVWPPLRDNMLALDVLLTTAGVHLWWTSHNRPNQPHYEEWAVRKCGLMSILPHGWVQISVPIHSFSPVRRHEKDSHIWFKIKS